MINKQERRLAVIIDRLEKNLPPMRADEKGYRNIAAVDVSNYWR